MKALLLTSCFLVMTSVGAHAAGEDLVNCKWKNGLDIEEKVCEALRRNAEADRVKQEEAEAAEKRWKAEQAQYQLEQEEKRRHAEEREAKWKLEFERSEAERKAAWAETLRTQAELDRQEQEAENRMLAKCGRDYRRPSIGMSLSRAKQCMGGLRLVSELRHKAGVVSMYESDAHYINILGGKVVSWGKL